MCCMCSAGVGRTGTFIAVDTLLRHIEHAAQQQQHVQQPTIDVYGVVYRMRMNRVMMVQTEVLRSLPLHCKKFNVFLQCYSLYTKLRLYNALVVPVLLYGAETWTPTKSDEQKLESFQMSCLRRILGIRWFDVVPNASVMSQTQQQSICNRIRNRRIRSCTSSARNGTSA